MLRRLWAAAFVVASLAVPALSACTSTGNVVDVHMALDDKGWRERNEFFTDSEKIFCVGKLGLGRPSAVVEMKIRQYQRYDFIANKFIDADGVAAVDEQQPERSKEPIDLSLELKPRGPTDGESGDAVPFTPGRYQCEVYLDGEVQGTAPFNILFPPCPEFSIAPETRCYGFYRIGDTCPRYGQSSTNPKVCKCTAEEGWACPGD
jgi:hypothetical protein